MKMKLKKVYKIRLSVNKLLLSKKSNNNENNEINETNQNESNESKENNEIVNQKRK